MPSEAIYALPDHEVVMELMPGILDRHFDGEAARQMVLDFPCAAPVAIEPNGTGRILWADFGVHPLQEWQYIFTVKQLAETGQISNSFSTDMSVLDDEDLFCDSVQPTGFIFHVSRCGSTLVTKALARPEENIMISQGSPLQRGFWAHITDDWRREAEPSPQNLRRFQSLIFAMTRRRIGNERRAFIKFISWNVLYLDFIAAAFPEVPYLFLYRNPAEVIASVKKATTAVLLARGTRQSAFLTGLPQNKVDQMGDTEYLAACYAHYFRTVLRSGTSVSLMDYRNLGPQAFGDVIASCFNYSADPADLLLMQDQFRYHSKDDDGGKKFVNDTARKKAALSHAELKMVDRYCSEPMAALRASDRNLRTSEGIPEPVSAYTS